MRKYEKTFQEVISDEKKRKALTQLLKLRSMDMQKKVADYEELSPKRYDDIRKREG